MTEHHAGMIVEQKAIEWWPYLGTVIDRINKAAEKMDIEALDETFLDVASLVSKRRKVTTVAGLKKSLDVQLSRYKSTVRDIAIRKSALKTGVGVRGNPVAKATLTNYKNQIWSLNCVRKKKKENIQRLVKTIKNFSPNHGKLVVRGNVPLKVFFGGKYPAKLEVEYKQGWQQLR